MESDGTFTARSNRDIDADKLKSLQTLANNFDVPCDEQTKTFKFDDLETLAVFFKAAHIAFHNKTYATLSLARTTTKILAR